jgi:hypothetical protein
VEIDADKEKLPRFITQISNAVVATIPLWDSVGRGHFGCLHETVMMVGH